MRSAGIPARVVTGYAGGTRNPYGDYWLVRKMDAHAWAEVWLPERGWTRVDPTAAVAPERIRDTLEDRLAQARAGGGTLDLGTRWLQVAQVGDWLRRNWNGMVLSFDARRQQQLLRAFGVERLQPAQLVGLFATFALLAIGMMAGCWRAGNASAIRCCVRGTGWTAAMPASAWAACRTKPPAAGPHAWKRRAPAAACRRSAAVSPMHATLAPVWTAHYCRTCAGIAPNAEHEPEHDHEHPHFPDPRRQPRTGCLCHRPQAVAGAVQHRFAA